MSFVEESAQQRVSRGLLAILRVYLGVVFLVAVWPKLTAAGTFAPRLQGFVERMALPNTHGFYRPVLESLVLPNPEFFAGLVIVGELLVGLALLTGTATRLAAAGAVLFTLNYMFAKGAWFWTPSSNDAAFVVIGLVLLLGAAGRAFGVDHYLARRWPRVAIW